MMELYVIGHHSKVRKNDPPQKLYTWDRSPKNNVSRDFNSRDKKRGIRVYNINQYFKIIWLEVVD